MIDGKSEGKMIKIIKTKEDYQAALNNIEKLMDCNPAVGSPEANRLELLVLLVKDYEAKNYPTDIPDPVDAILFRMEQQNLSQRDLVPFIGSRSKVSEVLSRKRPLTLSMIRALHKGLNIPLKVLLQEKNRHDSNDNIDYSRFPVQEMQKRGWISKSRVKIEDMIRDFLSPLGPTAPGVLYRMTRNESIRSSRPVDKYALMAWNARVIMCAKKQPLGKYKEGTINQSFLKELIELSSRECGPKLAQGFLNKHGIPLVIEPQLPGTHLDGAAIMSENEPIVGLTLRYDRLDNFWFTLVHELIHIMLHMKNDVSAFYDDLDTVNEKDQKEQEADNLAGEMLIPSSEWERSIAKTLRTPEAAKHLAEKLHIHPAIVAGRMRYYHKSYYILNQFVGHNKVRECFPGVSWR